MLRRRQGHHDRRAGALFARDGNLAPARPREERNERQAKPHAAKTAIEAFASHVNRGKARALASTVQEAAEEPFWRTKSLAAMSDAEWEDAYRAAWDAYFTWEHMETVTRRHARLEGGRPKKALQYMVEFKLLYDNEGVHTLEGGVVRRKRRKSRRPTHPREPARVL